MELTQAYLKANYVYDSLLGVLCNKRTGKIVGYKNKKLGYLYLRLSSGNYIIHRLIWLYVYGYLPENIVDHINRIRDDNRLCNLREISHQCNLRNCRKSKNNTSNITGVYWDNHYQKWGAGLMINRKSITLGKFDNFNQAVKARWIGEKNYNFIGCNSTSDSFLYLKNKNLLKLEVEYVNLPKL